MKKIILFLTIFASFLFAIDRYKVSGNIILYDFRDNDLRKLVNVFAYLNRGGELREIRTTDNNKIPDSWQGPGDGIIYTIAITPANEMYFTEWDKRKYIGYRIWTESDKGRLVGFVEEALK